MSVEAPERPTAAQITTEARDAAMQLRELRARPADQRSDTWNAELRDATTALLALDAELRVVEAVDAADARAAHEQARNVRGPEAAFTAGGNPEVRTPGDQFVGSEAWQTHVREGRDVKNSPGIQVERRTLITTSSTDTPSAGLFMPRGTPFLGNVDRRRLFVRDILPQGNTDLSLIPYIREVNPRSLETGATAVAEGAAKPEVTMQFSEADAPVRKIAAWIPVTTEILQDAPTLRAYVDARLVYMLQIAEENQILNGPTNSPNITGVRQTTGLQTQAAISGDRAATIGTAMGLIENVDLEGDGVAINPIDYWTMVTSRYSTRFDGSAVESAGNAVMPWGSPPQTVWGVPAVRTRAMPSGKALLGAWQLGAQIFDKEGVTIRTSDSHVDYFVQNKVVILAEERLALAVYRPDAFVEVTLA